MDCKLTFERLTLVLRSVPISGDLSDREIEQFLCCSDAGRVSSHLRGAADCGVKAFNGVGGING